MNKYEPLKLYFSSLKLSTIRLTFKDLEKILGCKLPPSAYKYSAWWQPNGHSHTYSWCDCNFKVDSVDLVNQIVFYKKESLKINNKRKDKQNLKKHLITEPSVNNKSVKVETNKYIKIDNYKFIFLQKLIPEQQNNKIIEYQPQNKYRNLKKLQLNKNGDGNFCKFSIVAPNISGVYLWVVDSEIIYIGETENLQKRFNNGYGRISPRNCYNGGQSTNCKMNKIVLNCYKEGKSIDLYFCETANHKEVEKFLLSKIKTRYNIINN